MEANEKICPFCAETIKIAAVVCKHCGRELTTTAQLNHASRAPIAPAKKKRGCLSLFLLKCHFVWVTKYRYLVLIGEVALSVREHIRHICMERDVRIIKGHVGRDHIHLFVSSPPNLALADLMQAIKGKSSRFMFQDHLLLKKRCWGQHLWTRGYFCASSGTVTDEVIKEYIEHQDIPLDGVFNVADDALQLQPASAEQNRL